MMVFTKCIYVRMPIREDPDKIWGGGGGGSEQSNLGLHHLSRPFLKSTNV